MGWGLRLRTLLTGVMILLACQVGEVLAAAQIKSVRIWRAPDNTRLVFDLSGPVQHSLFTLAAPNRIVIDVSGAQLATQLNGLKLGNTPITAVRSAQRTPNDLRMVLDLSAQVTECVADSSGLHQVSRHYTSLCDPRLNPWQALSAVMAWSGAEAIPSATFPLETVA